MAQVSALDLPATAADSAAHLSYAHFCSVDSVIGAPAMLVLDLEPFSRAKFKVVALDPTDPDSLAVTESNEVTFNGGTSDLYRPVILRATSTHPSIELLVKIAGAGLTQVSSASVLASDSSWNMPLEIVTKSASLLTVSAAVPAPLPASVLQLSTEGGGFATTDVPPDQILEATATDTTCYFNECYFVDPNPAVYPKDFALIANTVPNPWHNLYHLYYIRHNRNLPDNQNEASFGHAWSRDLKRWSAPDTTAEFPRGTVGWDKLHVWAPTIVQSGGSYYMFYTGVDSVNNQRIGYATTALIDTSNTSWTRQHAPIFTADSTAWAWTQSPQQFRDPFVMADPDSAGRFLMLYSGASSVAPHDYAVGLARNVTGTVTRWRVSVR